ncbi:hypothetical protein [Xanthomarina sp. F2636L]|uniref:hypothetical protein n=1 Tax=Xanthomarina sp. F2636L TaxID=2996018 RepID=UPI00225DD63F|nr:hypothetical protein [Xanthomarina sp. F2636L]MCX7551372.1 hypothetical protein [Xanthomarina sp. F2636L]
MQLRVIYILVFLVILCSSCQNNNEEIKVIGIVYNSIPKLLPSFNEKHDTISIDSKPKSGKKLKYAINENFVNDKFGNNISNYFYKYNEGKLKEKVSINHDYWSLVEQLQKQNNKGNIIDKKSFIKFIGNENVVFLPKKQIKNIEKLEYGVNAIISFSNVEFSKDYTKAAVTVYIYGDGLDVSLLVYVLQKEVDNWKIIYQSNIS